MKDFLSIDQLGQGELFGLLDLAVAQRRAVAESRLEPCLSGRVLAMLFSKPSLRTRVSFEVAMLQLGGHALYLSPAEVGLGSRESVPDVARVLSGYADAIMARVFAHADVVGLAEHATVPVINGLSDYNHPCQGLADLLTIRDAFGQLAGLKLVYLGDGNNVAHSLLIGGALAGMSVTVLHPPGYAPLPAVMQLASSLAAQTGGRVLASSDLGAADGADVLYTDVWASMGQEAEAATRKAHFAAYRIDEARLERAADRCIVLHCLPAHRGDEITDGVMDGPQSRVFAQAENRLHAQRALLSWLLGGVAL
jgi:ornithine carbamoyltransferase